MDAFLHAQFDLADADRDGFVTAAEFAVYYQSLGTCKARQQLRSSMGLEAESAPFTSAPKSLCIPALLCNLEALVSMKFHTELIM